MKPDPFIHTLLERLDGLPLALATVGAYLSQVSTPVKDYLMDYDESWQKLQEASPSLLTYEDRRLYSTWNLSMARIEHQSPNAAKLLRICGYLDNQDLWYELFTGGAEFAPSWFAKTVSCRLEFDRAIRLLCDHSLIERQESLDGYCMHNCVHSWLKNYVETETSPDDFYFSLMCVSENVSLEPPAGRTRLLSHANKLYTHLSITGCGAPFDKPVTLWAFCRLAILLYNWDSFEQAQRLLQLALEGFERYGGACEEDKLVIDYQLGLLLIQAEQLSEAETILRRVLPGYEELRGADDRRTLEVRTTLGRVYTKQGKPEAEALLQSALAGLERHYGSYDISTLSAMANLGLFYMHQGRFEEAEINHKKVLELQEDTLGPNHPFTIETVYNLGLVYAELGKLEEAETMLKRALPVFEVVYGLDNPNTKDVKESLSSVYYKQGRFAEADALT